MKKIAFLTASAACLLASCATIIDHGTEPVMFQAVGATEVWCDVASDKIKYRVRPPQEIQVKKSRRDLVLDCRAAGNRMKKMTVESKVSGWTLANITNGIIPGTAYDAETGAMFDYPDVVIIDFTDTAPTYSELPNYHAYDTLDPKQAAGMPEDMGSSRLKLPGDDAHALRHHMAELQREQADAVEAEKISRQQSVEGGWNGDKGNPGGMAEPAPLPSAPTF